MGFVGAICDLPPSTIGGSFSISKTIKVLLSRDVHRLVKTHSIMEQGKQPLVGVLALQGAFEEHQQCLESIGCRTVQVRDST